jgi:hypothetical protein
MEVRYETDSRGRRTIPGLVSLFTVSGPTVALNRASEQILVEPMLGLLLQESTCPAV